MHGQDDNDDPQGDEPLGEVISRLVESGKSYARAEINRQKIRASEVGLEFRNIAVLLGIAVFLTLAAAVALIVGILLALTPAIGAWGATAAVVCSTLGVVFVLLLLARSRFRRISGEER